MLTESQARVWALRLVAAHPLRRRALDAVAALGLPDCWLAAGFVRNAVWDSQYGVATVGMDLDVVYFDPACATAAADRDFESHLQQRCPGLRWSVKNQARMHARHGHAPYRSSVDAMACWPERQTAVAARLDRRGVLEGLAVFGFRAVFNGRVERNPRCAHRPYRTRCREKRWAERWPGLSVDTR
ncbi:MAG: nucleotidyltransferase family protein [Pseudomonadota bacterium]